MKFRKMIPSTTLRGATNRKNQDQVRYRVADIKPGFVSRINWCELCMSFTVFFQFYNKEEAGRQLKLLM